MARKKTTTANPFKVVPNGKCPVCQTDAPPHAPPIADQRYKQQVEMLRGEYKERHRKTLSDDEVHALWVKRMGGYIALCPKDGTDFFVKV